MRAHGDFIGILADIKEKSYSLVSLPDGLHEQIQEALQRVPEFLDKPAVQGAAYLESLEFGHLSLPHKRFFAVKEDSSVFFWPEIDDSCSWIKALFRSYNDFAQTMVAGVIPGIKPFLEEYPLDTGEISQSFMHLFQYTGVARQDGATLPCGEHTDSGLITIIPKSTAPRLQVLHCGEWVNVEENMQDTSTCIVLIGEELAGILGLQATVHRVAVTVEERISIPFQLRMDASQLCKSDPSALEKLRAKVLNLK